MTQFLPAGWPSTIAAAATAVVSATLLAFSNARSASCDVEKRATRHWSMWRTFGDHCVHGRDADSVTPFADEVSVDIPHCGVEALC